MSAILKAALAYRQLGLSIIPLPFKARDKKPIIKWKRWQTERADEAQIRKWFGRGQHGLAIITGGVSGLVVIDTDTAEAEAWAAENLPATPWVVQTAKGLHRCYRYPDHEIKTKIRPDSEPGRLGIDIKAEGGYVIAPPSIHPSGVKYTLVGTLPDSVDKLPVYEATWLGLEDKPKQPNKQPQKRPRRVITESRAYGRAALEGESSSVRSATEGGRNDTLNKALFSMYRLAAGGEIDQAEVEAELRDAALSVGLSEHEFEATKTSAKKGLAEPRTAPERPASRGNLALVPDTSEPDRARVVVTPHMADVVDQAEHLLHKAGGLYTRAGEIVRVTNHTGDGDQCLTRPDGAPVIGMAPVEFLRERCSAEADWIKCYEQKGETIERLVLPPAWVALTLIKRSKFKFPRLEGVTEAPTLRVDGSLIDQPGYDPKSGILYTPSAVFPKVPEAPTLQQAQDAAAYLLRPLSDFPWLDDTDDQAAALAAILTAVARHAVDGHVPLFAIRATTPGTGKSLLADAIGIIATGRAQAWMVDTGRDDETDKRILAIGLAGDPLVLIDNVDGTLGSPPLASALTAETYTARILGRTENANVVLRCVWFATGNGLKFKGDLGRRVVPIDLEANEEHPEDRVNFTHKHLLTHLKAERPRLLVAALTVLRGYIVADKPAGSAVFGSCERWVELICGAVEWVGVGNPIATIKRIRDEGDQDLDQLRDLIAAWDATFGDQTVTSKELISKAESPGNEDLKCAIECVASDRKTGGLSNRRLGNYLGKVKGRWASDKRIESGKKIGPGTRWRLKAHESVESPKTTPAADGDNNA